MDGRTVNACALLTAAVNCAPAGHLPLEGKADDTRETCYQKAFRHRPINIRGASLFLCAAPPFLISHLSKAFIPQSRGQHAHGLTLNRSFTTKSCALHSSLFYFFPFLTTVFASGFASALPRPRLPVFASFFAVMYQAGDLSVHLFCFTVGSFGYCFL